MDIKPVAYAKSNPIETLFEHTNFLLDNLDGLRVCYGEQIENLTVYLHGKNLWEILYIVCKYHDVGKIISPFQIKIRKKIISILEKKLKRTDITDEDKRNYEKERTILEKELGMLDKNKKIYKEIPHNLISPFLIFSSLKDFDLTLKTLIIRSIVYHHYQSSVDEIFKNGTLLDQRRKLESDIKINRYMAEELIGKQDFNFKAITFYKKPINQEVKKSYILLKGLLHRLDHSASAHLPVEVERISKPKEKLTRYLKKKCEERNIEFKGLKSFQEKAEEYRDKSVLLTASTGTGKTEFSINWIGEDKAFYTLPLRVSVNAMYERFRKIFSEEKVGLLHSGSLLYGLDQIDKKLSGTFSDDELSLEKFVQNVKTARQFSMPLTITTADQLFTSVFKWRGYEKIYATLMYSKVVLDEPQSYSPDTLAMIIKALEELSELGGKFCFMSATIHPFVREHLGKYCEIPEPVFNPEDKHKIRLSDMSIDDLKNEIEQAYEDGKKVLVIVNTVKKAQELYNELKENKNLLHSGFIQKHRRRREKQIQEDYKKEAPVIWITTQIVEASLDIDYDVLSTEIASIDALLQRMGRIFRKEGRCIKEEDEANIIIASGSPSDHHFIYSKEVADLTAEALKEFDGKILSDENKSLLMDKVYSDKEKISEFYQRFEYSYELLKDGFEAETPAEARKLFRDISNITIIPIIVYEKNQEIIDDALGQLTANDNIKKLHALKELNDFTLSLPIYRAKHHIGIELRRGVFLADIDYDEKTGIIFNNKTNGFENII